jgi:two-component system response regulator DevR
MGDMSLKVYIAEDSSLVRQRLADMLLELEERGTVEVVGRAWDARGAIDAIRELKPDVAILDVRLAEGSGIEVLQAVKGDPAPPVVIMLTAFPYPQYRQKCLEAGADYFFDKLTEFERVAEAVAALQDEQSEAEKGREAS